MKHIVAGGGTGGTEEVVRVGRPKCRAFTCLALLWITATLASLPSFEDLKLTKEVVTQETLWLVGALAPSIVFTCLACFYRLTEQPREYHAGDDLEKLYGVRPSLASSIFLCVNTRAPVGCLTPRPAPGEHDR